MAVQGFPTGVYDWEYESVQLAVMANDDYSRKTIHGTYYPHIDGIRALAVIPVVLYHLCACLCPGGFAGVDVFFVISGYLITGGILRDLSRDRFTISDFYHRRIRRILPAYTALIIVVFLVGCVVYYSWLLRDLGEASVAGSLFTANLYFWKMANDYFAANSHNSPLLHLWSLSVEEQFYMVIPLLCFILWKINRRWIAPVLGLLMFLSLAGSIWATRSGNQSQAFYFLHFRAWELLAGSVLAMIPEPRKTFRDPTNTRLYIVMSWIGLLLVITPYLVLSSSTPFPGGSAIPSVLGTVLLIRYGQAGLVGKLLSWRLCVGVGKISYSLYLWHWPVIVIWRYLVYNQLTVFDYIGMFMLSFSLAYISWRLIEMPVRNSQIWTKSRTFTYGFASILTLVCLGMACSLFRGWPTVIRPQANKITMFYGNPQPGRLEYWVFGNGLVRRLPLVNQLKRVKSMTAWGYMGGSPGQYHMGVAGKSELLLIGDSHSGVLRYGLNQIMLEFGQAGTSIYTPDTRMFDISSPTGRIIVEKLSGELSSANNVLVASFWAGYRDPDVMYQKLEEFAVLMKQMNKTLYILTDVPYLPYHPIDMSARLQITKPRIMNAQWEARQQEAQYLRDQGKINDRLKKLSQKTGARLIPTHLALRQGAEYVFYEPIGGERRCLYKDENHLSPYGSMRAARYIIPHIFNIHGSHIK